jgi:predicted TPR repeat methyltransferase
MKDINTTAYFDLNLPVYGVTRYEHAARMIRRIGGSHSTLIDIGCGTGAALEFISDKTGLKEISGLDTSRNSLSKAEKRIGFETYPTT